MSEVVVVQATARDNELRSALDSGATVLFSGDAGKVPTDVAAALIAAASAEGIGSASPVPAHTSPVASTYSVHPASPPAPTLALPCPRLCALSVEAFSSMTEPIPPTESARRLLDVVARRMVQHGWRHIAAPGVGLRWDPSDVTSGEATAAWSSASVASIVGSANVGLEAHRSWAEAQTGSVRLAVDGACLDNTPHTGTQHLVLEISRWLAATRPSAHVMLAVRPSMIEQVQRLLGDTSVAVVARTAAIEADVVYRPYQMLYARELDFVLRVGRRGLIGQLDMIGFSNPFYHPSDQLFFFARNLQRHLMRSLDGVTFISGFGRDSAFAECPDLDDNRLHVVSCGADPRPLPGALEPDREIDADTPFVLCLASTFWHKNRCHAISTFSKLASEHGYRGHLVLGGPQPYYGRSLDSETELLAALPANIAGRVHRWGHIGDGEKWWLLRHAHCVFYPSVVEGFGLVPFEAAAVGTPCLVHASTAPGELLGQTSGAVHSWAPVDWAAQAAHVLSDPEASATLVDEVLAVGAMHTWRRCADLTWDAIDRALAGPRRALHADDGHALARVAPESHRAPGTAMRFDVARGIPGLRRRAAALSTRVRRRPES